MCRLILGLVLAIGLIAPAAAGEFVGRVFDAESGEPLASRVYLQDEAGGWHFALSDDPAGSAIEYRKQRGERSVEMHTSLSAHVFRASLPPGPYVISIHRGKEYLPVTQKIVIGDEPAEATFRLPRWINMAERGWYSGDTHVHRSIDELKTVALAEDLNVSLPLTSWVTQAFQPPSGSDKSDPHASAELIQLDSTHVIYPRNTEYEIFTVDGQPHTLGAVFILGHKSLFEFGVPPVKPVAEQARKEGALLELDKHNWPWSMALVPVMNVDLFELSNNHVWQTEFMFSDFGEPPADYMKIERTEHGFTERGWIDFGFQNYYALLDCGFRLRPTAGTATGVHPVPLGFGRVYVHLPEGFSYAAWMQGLDAGRSFVTTGPMLMATFNGQPPGHTFAVETGASPGELRIAGSAISATPLTRLEIVSARGVVREYKPANSKNKEGAYESAFDEALPFDGSTWFAVRCYEEPEKGRIRFAHTAPVHVDVPGKPLRPRREVAEYLLHRVQTQLDRSRDVLPREAVDEYKQARDAYQRVVDQAK